MANIGDEIRASFKNGTNVTKLIYINLAVFLAARLLFVIFTLISPSMDYGSLDKDHFLDNFLTYFMLPSDIGILIFRPWTVITYMFLHFHFLHILGNMLWLFWFGRIFIKYMTEKQLLSTYLLGGLAGAFLFVLAMNIFPGLEAFRMMPALGASAAVMAVVISISVYAPDYNVYIPIIGPVKIKYIALVFIIWDVMQIASTNAGGHIAHIGGALYGYYFARQMKQGKDAGSGFNRTMDAFSILFKRNRKMKVSYKSNATRMDDMQYNQSKAENQKEIDRILDKIAQSGYDSLNKKEKETLFKMSNNS